MDQCSYHHVTSLQLSWHCQVRFNQKQYHFIDKKTFSDLQQSRIHGAVTCQEKSVKAELNKTSLGANEIREYSFVSTNEDAEDQEAS